MRPPADHAFSGGFRGDPRRLLVVSPSGHLPTTRSTLVRLLAPTPPCWSTRLETPCCSRRAPSSGCPRPSCSRCGLDHSGCGLAAERTWLRCCAPPPPYSPLAHPRLGFSGVDATRTNPRYLASVARLGLGVALASDSCRASCLGRHGGVASLAAGPACNGRPARRLSSPSAHAHSSPCLPFAARAGPGALLAQSRP